MTPEIEEKLMMTEEEYNFFLSINTLTREIVFWGYHLLLGRNPENEEIIQEHLRLDDSIAEFRKRILLSPEFKERYYKICHHSKQMIEEALLLSYNRPITGEAVFWAFQLVLGREIGSPDFIGRHLNLPTVIQLGITTICAHEFKIKYFELANNKIITKSHTDFRYRAPIELAKDKIKIKNVLLIGSCLSETFMNRFKKNVIGSFNHSKIDHILVNNVSLLPATLPQPIENYSFQILQVPLRAVINETVYFRLDFHDKHAFELAFQDSVNRLTNFLNNYLKYNTEHNLTTFVTNFMAPQQNLMGRLMPKYDLRNIVYYVEELNKKLVELIQQKTNIYLIDIDEIAATFGRRYIQDDSLHITTHGSLACNFDFGHDQKRLHPPKRYTEHIICKTDDFLDAIWHEILAQYKTLNQHDAVKIVIVDLDDTLWRGIVAEEGIHESGLEGWPLGIVEALLHLKKRGILLAIASKNEETVIKNIWNDIFHSRLKLEDFVVKKINWKEKSENIQEILKEVNLLPSNALFIDDNPIERKKIETFFPEIRTLGTDLYYIKRILLWSPETQVPYITEESAQRTTMIQAQVERDQMSQEMSREEFLASLELHIEFIKIDSINHPDFKRSFELLNKTNQFNTTGKRWSMEECTLLFEEQGFFYVFKVKDKFTSYGLVGIVLIKKNHILQFAMSCRVIGLDIEKSALTNITSMINVDIITASFIETAFNFSCRELYHNFGFYEKEREWHYKKKE
jgi:FkbH-like protein